VFIYDSKKRLLSMVNVYICLLNLNISPTGMQKIFETAKVNWGCIRDSSVISDRSLCLTASQGAPSPHPKSPHSPHLSPLALFLKWTHDSRSGTKAMTYFPTFWLKKGICKALSYQLCHPPLFSILSSPSHSPPTYKPKKNSTHLLIHLQQLVIKIHTNHSLSISWRRHLETVTG